MNLHKAKGLEAPIVILACPVGVAKFPPSLHVDREGGASKGYLACSKKVGRKSMLLAIPPDWQEKQQCEQVFLDAEKARLLYVAATRAGRALIVSTRAARPGNSPWGDLQPFMELEGVRRLDDIELPAVPAKEPTPAHGVPADARLDLLDRLQTVQQPTGAIRSAKTFALAEGEAVTSSAPGLGHAWGLAVHHVLECLIRHPDVPVASAAWDAAGLYDLDALAEATGQTTAERVEQIIEIAQRVASSAIWQRAQQAKQRLVEVPYVRPIADDELPTLERGVIDLAFEEDEGWVLVDYKTDAAARDNPAGVLEHYQPQLALYAEAWQELTGQPVQETGLYFVATDQYQPCPRL